MRKELNILFNALLFYSRIRVPKSVVCNQETLSQAFRYFPLVGLIVGGIGVGVLWLCSFALPLNVAVVMAMIAMMLTTGAFHEDGLADFADGFGAGRDKEGILRIMKDSHIGTYGVLALALALLLKFTLMSSLGDLQTTIIAIVAAQGASRFIAVTLLSSTPYVSSAKSKATHATLGVKWGNVVVAALFGILPTILLGCQILVAYFAVALIAMLIFRGYIIRKIGGCTGDTLGAMQQIAELLFYITTIIIQSQQ